MIKRLILTTLVFTSLYSDNIKVTTLDKQDVNYSNGQVGITQFRILCINGYKWLQFGVNSGSVSQMFESNINGIAIPIKCENK